MSIATFHDLSGCEIELVPDAGIGLTGSNLTTWSDQSGKGRNATVANAVTDGFASATGPIYAASDAAFGGKPSITWGSPNTSCLAHAPFTIIAPPVTVICAGQSRSGLSAVVAPVAFDRLNANGSGTRLGFFCSLASTAGPNDTLIVGPWASAVPVANAPRRFAAANGRVPFVMGIVWRSSTFGWLVHNGIIRGMRAMVQSGTPTGIAGFKLGRDFTNAIDGQEWVGPLSLFVAYSRELSRSEMKDALTLASSKCGIPIVTGRLAA